MSTITKEIADDVIAGKYDEDNPIALVEYTNNWGVLAYGLICEGQRVDMYAESAYVHQPRLYWKKAPGIFVRLNNAHTTPPAGALLTDLPLPSTEDGNAPRSRLPASGLVRVGRLPE